MEQIVFPEFPVLVVDDEKNFLNSLDFILRSKKLTNIECCDDSSNVMTLLKSRNHSVVLLDLKMQGITGEELLEKIVEEYPGIPVIMLTAIDMVEIAVNCMKKGAFDYMVKPVDTEKLIKRIHEALKKSKNIPKRKTTGRSHGDMPMIIDSKIDEVEYKTTIYFHLKPPELFSAKEEEQVEEKKFLESFFQLRKGIRIDIEKISKDTTEKKEIELRGMEGLAFCYLAYKNYKALKNPEYPNWKKIPETYEFRFSGKPQRNKRHIPEWKILSNYLERNERTPDEGTIRQWILSINSALKEKGITGIVDTSTGGRGKGYLLKGRVEFTFSE